MGDGMGRFLGFFQVVTMLPEIAMLHRRRNMQ